MTGGLPAWLVDLPFAHRGLHGDGLPENSLAAVGAAADAGYAVELDVQLSADGHVVVFHDLDLDRATGLGGRARDLSLAELAERRLHGSDHPIPTLADALAELGDRVPVMVELKSFGRRVGRLEQAVAELLDAHRGPFCVASFNPRAVDWFRTRRPSWIRGQAAGLLLDVPIPGWLRPPLRRMAWNRRTEPAFISYELEALPHPAVERARRRGAAVLTWTVRTTDDLAHARRHADNIIFEHIRP